MTSDNFQSIYKLIEFISCKISLVSMSVDKIFFLYLKLILLLKFILFSVSSFIQADRANVKSIV